MRAHNVSESLGNHLQMELKHPNLKTVQDHQFEGRDPKLKGAVESFCNFFYSQRLRAPGNPNAFAKSS